MNCNRSAQENGPALPYEEVKKVLAPFGQSIDDLPIVKDNTNSQEVCVVCGSPAEWHHWAPTAYAEKFGEDWSLYPTAPLCRYHHFLWHDIVTPGLVKKR